MLRQANKKTKRRNKKKKKIVRACEVFVCFCVRVVKLRQRQAAVAAAALDERRRRGGGNFGQWKKMKKKKVNKSTRCFRSSSQQQQHARVSQNHHERSPQAPNDWLTVCGATIACFVIIEIKTTTTELTTGKAVSVSSIQGHMNSAVVVVR